MSENSLLTELEWRGLISQTTDRKELSEALDKKPLTLYVGFDPTAPSLHVGNLVVLLALRRFQLAGHRPCLLYTSPSPRDRTRSRMPSSA